MGIQLKTWWQVELGVKHGCLSSSFESLDLLWSDNPFFHVCWDILVGKTIDWFGSTFVFFLVLVLIIGGGNNIIGFGVFEDLEEILGLAVLDVVLLHVLKFDITGWDFLEIVEVGNLVLVLSSLDVLHLDLDLVESVLITVFNNGIKSVLEVSNLLDFRAWDGGKLGNDLLSVLDLLGEVGLLVLELLGLDLVLHELGHSSVLGVEHASDIKLGSDEHSSVLVLDLVLSLLIHGGVSSFHLLVVSDSELVESSLSLGFLNRLHDHETNVDKGDDDEEDNVGVTHHELHGVDSDEVSVDHEVIDEYHDHGLIEEFDGDSLLVDMWSSGSIPEEVAGVNNQENLKLHEWILVEHGWDHHKEDSSKHRDWKIVLGGSVSVHVDVEIHVVELVSAFLGLELVTVVVEDLGEEEWYEEHADSESKGPSLVIDVTVDGLRVPD